MRKIDNWQLKIDFWGCSERVSKVRFGNPPARKAPALRLREQPGRVPKPELGNENFPADN